MSPGASTVNIGKLPELFKHTGLDSGMTRYYR
jgi:hypothetical protein